MMNCFRKAVLSIAGLFFLFVAFAAPQEYLSTTLDVQSGLSDNCVNDVLFDSENFLWIGTNEGLDFYEGTNVMHFDLPHPESGRPSVVFSLCEDNSGAIWAGCSNGLYCVRKSQAGVSRFDNSWLKGVPVRQMCCDRNGILWIPRNGNDLLQVNTVTGLVTTLPVDCKSICVTCTGTVYVLTKEDCLMVSSDGQKDLEPVSSEIDRILFNKGVSRMVCAAGRLFLSSGEGAPFVLDLATHQISKVNFLSKMRDVLEHTSGELWVAARDGIHILDSCLVQKRVFRPYHDNSFRCLAQDHKGGVWGGTLFEGLARICPNNLNFRHYSEGFTGGGSFKARDFVEDAKGYIWVGSDSQGLLCLDMQNDCERSVCRYFAGRNITGLMAEGNRLWVGTIDNELPVACLDSDSGKITYYPQAGKSAYAFCRDAEGRLWIGGKDGFTVGRDKVDSSFEKDIFIPSSQVCRIICASDESVWVASISGQVFRYASSSFTTYHVPVSNILTDIAEDANGRILATSEGSGLWEFDREEARFEPCSGKELHLQKIAMEKGGSLIWITGTKGIQVSNIYDDTPLPEISRESLKIDRFNYSSNFIDSRGVLYAGTSDGFISFSTRNLLQTSSPVRPPVISSFQTLASSGETEGGIHLCPDKMILDNKARSFKVNVSPLDYADFPRKKLFWKIEGRSDWTPVDGGSFNVYDIPVGKWDLKVKAVSFAGESSLETVLKLAVQPHLLLSLPAILLYVLFLIIALVEVAVLTNRRAKAKAAKQHERKLFESKMEFLTSIAHEIRTPLTLVQVPLEALMRKFASTKDASVQENLDIIRRNSLKLTILINELLDFRKLSDSTFQIRPEFIDVRNVVKDAHRRFHPMFLQEGKSLSISVPDQPVYCETDVRSFGRILDNLLSNALKYSQNRTALVLSADGKDAALCLENDGKIIPEDFRKKVFKPFYRYEAHDEAKIEGTGLGLSTSLQFAQMLGGSLVMDDDMSVNRFIFTVPLAVTHEYAAPLSEVRAKDKIVMVVEDDKDMLSIIRNILNDSYDVATAHNGKEALEKIEKGTSPSLIVSDVIMPEIDGIEFTKQLKSNLTTSHIPVILLSAEIPDTLMQKSLDTGADAYLEKPFSPKKLRAMVDNLIDNRKRVYEFYLSSLPSDAKLPTGRVSTQEQKFLRTIQEYVSENLHRAITLDDLAEAVCLSSSSLYKKMKEYADISPMEYVMKVRLHRAVELLKDDSVSVQDVAMAVGFNTHSFFSECFKREFGMTPRQWRLKNVTKATNTK